MSLDTHDAHTALQRQTAVTAYLKSNLLCLSMLACIRPELVENRRDLVKSGFHGVRHKTKL